MFRIRNEVRPAVGAVLAGFLVVGAASGGAPKTEEDRTVEIVPFGGWERNLKLSNGDVELIITLEVGPRILSYRLLDGENVFKVYEDQLGGTGEATWQIRGGHRLWASPEDPERTYVPDNGPVLHEELGPGRVLVSLPPDPKFQLQKEMEIALAPSGSGVEVAHRIKNAGESPTQLAIWSLSVMNPGGLEVIPLPPKAPHPGGPETATAEQYAPQLSLALWSYTDLTDPRWHFGSRAILLRQEPERDLGPTKIGLSNRLGVVGYWNGGAMFVKRFAYHPGRLYPDFGSNYETFTNQDMLELESLGPLVRLGPGETVEHTERWELLSDVPAPENETEWLETVLPLLDGDDSGR